MDRKAFEEMSFEDVMETLAEQGDIRTDEQLKEFAIQKIKSDGLFVAIHILKALNDEPGTWYIYDYNMGVLETPLCVKCKEDVEHLIDD